MTVKYFQAWGIFICIVSVLLFAASCQNCNHGIFALRHWATVIPPKCLTDTRLSVIQNRLQMFWNQYEKVPTTIDELPEQKNLDCSTKDGWGHEFYWKSDGISRVEVWSLGRDGTLGGTNEDADVKIVFEAIKKDENRPSLSL